MKISECKEMFAMLSQYLDEELPDDVCREIDSHIAGCPPCVKFVESLKKSVDLCRECKEIDNPGPLPERAREELFSAYQKALAASKRAQA
jgi:anti-sigma factor RsiW